MPNIQEKLDKLSKSKYFTLLDLTSGYWQFEMDPEAKKWTAFKSHMGNYEFNRMPFGLCNAGATFQRAMEKLLINLDFAGAYIDDIMVHSTTMEQHLIHLREVFSRLRASKLKAKISKCQFATKTAKFLGFIVSNGGISVDTEKVESVKTFPIPRGKKEVKRFIGFASYYRRFIPKFADIAEPLNNLTRSKTKFVWDDECQRAFDLLKEKLIESILTQLDKDGHEQVICYGSRALQDAERRYSTVEREALTMVWATKIYRMYLTSVKFEFLTDQKSLVHLGTMKDASKRLEQFWLKFFRIQFRHQAQTRQGKCQRRCSVESRAESNQFDRIRWKMDARPAADGRRP